MSNEDNQLLHRILQELETVKLNQAENKELMKLVKKHEETLYDPNNGIHPRLSELENTDQNLKGIAGNNLEHFHFLKHTKKYMIALIVFILGSSGLGMWGQCTAEEIQAQKRQEQIQQIEKE